jgi:hypothetical protein
VPGEADTVIINTGTTTITDIVTVAGLYMSAGTISGDSNLTVTDSLSWTGGTIGFSSTESELKTKLIIASTAKANMNGYGKMNRCLVNEGELYLWDISLYFGSNVYKTCFLYGTIYDNNVGYKFINFKNGSWFINYGKYLKSGTGACEVRYTQFVNKGEVKIYDGSLLLSAAYGAESGSYWIGKQGNLKVTGPRTFEGAVRCEGLLNFYGQYSFHIKDTFDIKGEFKPEGYSWVYFDAGSTPLLDLLYDLCWGSYRV